MWMNPENIMLGEKVTYYMIHLNEMSPPKIYIYIYIYIWVYIGIYIYIYLERKREKENRLEWLPWARG